MKAPVNAFDGDAARHRRRLRLFPRVAPSLTPSSLIDPDVQKVPFAKYWIFLREFAGCDRDRTCDPLMSQLRLSATLRSAGLS